MDKEKILKVSLVILMVIAVLVWAKGCQRPQMTAAAPLLNQGEISSLLAMSSGEAALARSSYPTWGRNPFVLETKQSIKKLTLNGIIWDDQSPKALLGDRIVGVGESVGAAVVVEIHQDRVILNNGIEYFELRLGEE